MTVKFRPALPKDAGAIGEIAAASAGGGAFGVNQRMYAEPYSVFTRHPQTDGLVGYTPDHRIVSYFFFRPMTLMVDGVPTRGIFGFNLAVHPEYRRQGIGGKTLHALSDLAQDLDACILVCEADGRNAASRNLFSKNGWIEAARYTWTIVPTRRKRPDLPAGVRVRRAELSDLAEWASEANHFYRYHELWQPLSDEILEAWLGPQHSGIERSLYLAEDHEGRLLAGVGCDDINQLFSWAFEGGGALMRTVGRAIKLWDDHGRIRIARAMVPWFQNGYAEVARSMWQWLRWNQRQDANLLTISYDPRSPVSEVLDRAPFFPSRDGYRYVSACVELGRKLPTVPDLF